MYLSFEVLCTLHEANRTFYKRTIVKPVDFGYVIKQKQVATTLILHVHRSIIHWLDEDGSVVIKTQISKT